MRFRRQREEAGDLQAAVQMWSGEGILGLNAVSVALSGDPSQLLHLPGACWDKLLGNLTRAKAEQQDLFERFREMLLEGADAWNSDEQVSLVGAPLTDEAGSDPDATVTVELVVSWDRERIGAITKFRPFPRAENPGVAEAALWSIWDAVVLTVGRGDDYTALLQNLLGQASYYETEGLPRGIGGLGRAPFYGAMKGASDRLAAEIGAIEGLSLEEFRALPESEQDRLIDEHTRLSLESIERGAPDS
jgi:hypothetical protein